MKCIQCERPAAECTVVRIILVEEKVKSVLCKKCVTCYRCGTFSSTLRPGTQLRYTGNPDAFIVHSTVNYRHTRVQVVCESAPWKCMLCDISLTCRICGKGELLKGNCHARCFDVWCVLKIENMLPKDLIIYILRNFEL